MSKVKDNIGSRLEGCRSKVGAARWEKRGLGKLVEGRE